MSKADEMFEELGYTKAKDEKVYIKYTKTTNAGIETIYFLNKEVAKEFNIGYGFVTIPELKAINEKAKELGWHD